MYFIPFSYILEWLSADYVLYNHFKKKFLNQIEIYGHSRLEYEKNVLKRMANRTISQCKLKLSSPNHYHSGISNSCKYYTKGVVALLSEAKRKQNMKSLEKLKEENEERKRKEREIEI